MFVFFPVVTHSSQYSFGFLGCFSFGMVLVSFILLLKVLKRSCIGGFSGAN